MPAPFSDEPNLDPQDWGDFRRSSRRALDSMIEWLETIRERPVWTRAPDDVRANFQTELPHTPRAFDAVLDEFETMIRPYSVGNTHPAFMGWVHGAGTPVGMVAEMLAAGLDANCGGRDHIGIEVERQITLWAAELFKFPATASGLFVTGTSMANFLGLLVARNHALGDGVRRSGLRDAKGQLTAYMSAEAHGCIKQAMEMSGIGSANLRPVPVDDKGRMRRNALAALIASDRAAGSIPFLVVGTAGTVNTGAIDDLDGIADVAEREELWFHVDGAFGALAALAPSLRPPLKGIERAQSIAFDFHKWAHVPYDAGFLLVRDGDAHRRTFVNPAAYLSREPEGLAAGDVWPCDLGPDLSRGFRALKTWFTFKVHGADRIGATIAHSCELARQLARRIEASEIFELRAPVTLNIVCFGLKCSADGALNRDIVVNLQKSGRAAPSMTIIDGKPVIRCAIVNHRTTEKDIERFVYDAALAALDAVQASARPKAPAPLRIARAAG